MRTVAVAFLLLFPIAARAAADSPAAVATALQKALVRDDPRLYVPLAITPEQEPSAFEELRELIDNNDCITITRFDWNVLRESADRATIRLDLHGFSLLKGASHQRVPLPRFWYLELRRDEEGWKIATARTAERMTGLAMQQSASLADAECVLFEEGEAEPLRALAEYSDVLAFGNRGDLERAAHARALAESFGNVWARVFTMRNQAVIAAIGDQPGAMALAEETVRLARTEGSTDDVADALFTAGIARYFGRDYLEARRLLLASAELVDETIDPVLPLKAQHMANYVTMLRGDLLHALDGTRRLRETSQRYGWNEGEEVAAFSLTDIYRALRNYELSLEWAQRARALAETNAHPEFFGYALTDIGSIEEKLGRLDDAVRHIEEGVAAFGASANGSGANLGVAALHLRRDALDKVEEALRLSNKVLERVDVDGRASQVAYHRLWSELHLRRGETAAAIASAREATKVPAHDEDRRSLDERTGAMFALGHALRVAGQNDEAVEVLRRGIAGAESIREWLPGNAVSRITFFEDTLSGYVDLVELLVDRGESREALRVAEQMKGRALRDVLARGHIDLSATMNDEERQREEELEARMVRINRELAEHATDQLREEQQKARNELEMFRVEIGLRHPAIERRRLDAVDRLTYADPSMAVVEYVIGERQITAFVLSGASIETVRIPVARKELEAKADAFARIVAARSLRYEEPAQQLYQLLVAPLERQIGGKELLAIIPDGVLWSVPFQALMPRAATHLVDRHAIFYAQSLSLLDHALMREKGGEPRLLAFGNPTVGNSTQSTVRSALRDVPLGALPDAETEVRSISNFYESRRAYWRDAARESVFKEEAANYDIIHVAAHAVVDDRAPMYSAIVLATAKNEHEDGLLEAREVAELNLNANLAVLSACDTARGKVGAGEGVIGIAWAFFAAGCPTTVVSQWKAESRATAELMVEFHRRLVRGETTAAALRGAQRKVRSHAEYRHPFYWAPFVAVGAAGGRNATGRTGS